MNGAGKTTTFQMLTGENAVSSGDAYIQGYSVQTDWRKVKNFWNFDQFIDFLGWRDDWLLSSV